MILFELYHLTFKLHPNRRQYVTDTLMYRLFQIGIAHRSNVLYIFILSKQQSKSVPVLRFLVLTI